MEAYSHKPYESYGWFGIKEGDAFELPPDQFPQINPGECRKARIVLEEKDE